MDVLGKPITIYVDENILDPLDTWAREHRISRSSAIRLIISDFFLKKEVNK